MVDVCAIFHITMSILILSAFDSRCQLMTYYESCYEKKDIWDSHIIPKCEIYAKLELYGLLRACARECDGSHG